MVPIARWQAITDASVFYLLSSTHSASLASTSLFGLAYWPTYHYYHGHVMWDIETFTVPATPAARAHAAHALLDYRSRHLTAAHHNAALHGWRGAMYPWESCPQHGEESTPGARPYTEDHVSADIALAFVGYVNATGDRDYARRVAWPVLRSVAEFVVSRVDRTRRGYEIRRTVGPREVYATVDNNAYTNMSAALALGGSGRVRRRDRRAGARRSGTTIADGACRARDRRRGAIINHDGARLSESQGGVPEGAAGLFPLGYRDGSRDGTRDVPLRRLEQAPLYVGAPMLSALLPVYAARAGESALARRAARTAATETSSMSRSWSRTNTPGPATDRPRASPMFANLSGYLTSAAVRLHRAATWSGAAGRLGRRVRLRFRTGGVPSRSNESGSAGNPMPSKPVPARQRSCGHRSAASP